MKSAVTGWQSGLFRRRQTEAHWSAVHSRRHIVALAEDMGQFEEPFELLARCYTRDLLSAHPISRPTRSSPGYGTSSRRRPVGSSRSGPPELLRRGRASGHVQIGSRSLTGAPGAPFRRGMLSTDSAPYCCSLSNQAGTAPGERLSNRRYRDKLSLSDIQLLGGGPHSEDYSDD